MASIAAFDVDLHRVHGWSAQTNSRICYNATEWPFEAFRAHTLVLVEIASPVDYSASSGEAYNRRKWAIGNAMMIGRLMMWAEEHGQLQKLLVSPSHLWTLGYEEEMRGVVAGTAGQDNHDIRACREMLFFFGTNPEKWKPIVEYYQSISTRRKKK